MELRLSCHPMWRDDDAMGHPVILRLGFGSAPWAVGISPRTQPCRHADNEHPIGQRVGA